jgi:hypothetical protein
MPAVRLLDQWLSESNGRGADTAPNAAAARVAEPDSCHCFQTLNGGLRPLIDE